jgi:predicted NBD/HSP70 family sugar kinase
LFNNLPEAGLVASSDHFLKPEGRREGRGVAADELRRHNLEIVLSQLHLDGPQSRSDLTRVTGLNRSTVGDLVGELAELGLVDQAPQAVASGPGRPSRIISARPAGAVALALEISVDAMAIATIGLGGQVFDRQRFIESWRDRSPTETVQRLAALARPLLAALPAQSRIVGIGCGVAGVTRRADGFVHLAPNLGWVDVPLREIITSCFGAAAPVLVANEADLGAFGEYRRGAAPHVEHLVYLSGGVGIGAGVVIDGRVLRGRSGYAGEAGHTVINPGGVRCRCGAIGCWETEAGEAGLLRRLDTDIALEEVPYQAIADLAAAGDPATLDAIAAVGHWLGMGIANMVNVFNPEAVLLGGLYAPLFRYLEDSLRTAVTANALAAAESMVTIGPSALGLDAPLIGAAETIFSRFLADPAGSSRVAPAQLV